MSERSAVTNNDEIQWLVASLVALISLGMVITVILCRRQSQSSLLRKSNEPLHNIVIEPCKQEIEHVEQVVGFLRHVDQGVGSSTIEEARTYSSLRQRHSAASRLDSVDVPSNSHSAETLEGNP